MSDERPEVTVDTRPHFAIVCKSCHVGTAVPFDGPLDGDPALALQSLPRDQQLAFIAFFDEHRDQGHTVESAIVSFDPLDVAEAERAAPGPVIKLEAPAGGDRPPWTSVHGERGETLEEGGRGGRGGVADFSGCARGEHSKDGVSLLVGGVCLLCREAGR